VDILAFSGSQRTGGPPLTVLVPSIHEDHHKPSQYQYHGRHQKSGDYARAEYAAAGARDRCRGRNGILGGHPAAVAAVPANRITCDVEEAEDADTLELEELGKLEGEPALVLLALKAPSSN